VPGSVFLIFLHQSLNLLWFTDQCHIWSVQIQLLISHVNLFIYLT